MSALACPYCVKEFTPRNFRQKTCGSDECRKAYHRARHQTDEYKAYNRARHRTDECKAYQRVRRQTEEYKAYRRAYEQTDDRKAYRRARERIRRIAEALGVPPLVFAAMKIMSQLQEPNHDTSQRTA